MQPMAARLQLFDANFFIAIFLNVTAKMFRRETYFNASCRVVKQNLQDSLLRVRTPFSKQLFAIVYSRIPSLCIELNAAMNPFA
jgi:hypothetical protein